MTKLAKYTVTIYCESELDEKSLDTLTEEVESLWLEETIKDIVCQRLLTIKTNATLSVRVSE